MLTKRTLFDHWSDVPEDVWRWPNFTPREIACKGTGSLLLDPRAMDMLQSLRDRIGRPMIVTSGYRSPSYNRKVGGASRSKHMEGIAFDVLMDNHDPHAFIQAARQVGFQGIGTYPRQNFVHVDARPNAAGWGKPFPAEAAPFSSARPRLRESLSGSRTLHGAGAAGAGTAGAAATEQVSDRLEAAEPSVVERARDAVVDAQGEIGSLLPLIDSLWWVFVALSIAGIGLTVYARIDDWKKLRR